MPAGSCSLMVSSNFRIVEGTSPSSDLRFVGFRGLLVIGDHRVLPSTYRLFRHLLWYVGLGSLELRGGFFDGMVFLAFLGLTRRRTTLLHGVFLYLKGPYHDLYRVYHYLSVSLLFRREGGVVSSSISNVFV